MIIYKCSKQFDTRKYTIFRQNVPYRSKTESITSDTDYYYISYIITFAGTAGVNTNNKGQ